MPSCVVKWCKNNTTLHKKCQGITFHRFPSGNEPWNDDWVTIIRKCRGQEDWIPTKSSVVCSTHFDQNDLLTSSKGRRRVVTFAVPQLLLFEPPKQKEQPRVEPETKSTSQAVHCDRDQEQQSLLGSDALLFEPPIKEEQPDDEPETTSSAQAVYYDHDQEQLSSLESDAEFFEPPIKEEQPDVEPDTSSLQAV
ncbi:peroxynitrite isomerase THAP4-like isoform X1 [Helicoverpa zea]|uniref:peroxynitrite isomerase THAP4-like isoform X1 n=1 Tax=Helicoverpa zea TaxID=7113 RepID=UPI001F584FC9|nr:peroxynitrite isomerase THAP4-like isoform X1 [Helicoverpa zea]